MDDLDRKLIAQLRLDGRMPVAMLAAKLDVSRGTIQKRLDKLINSNAIRGFTVRTREEIDTNILRAMMNIKTSGKKPAAIIKALNGLPEVVALYTTNGVWDYVAELRAETLADFDRVLREVRSIDGVATTETSLLLGSV
ncbi:Lrp/AsnC family transcriptional regulator [Rhizobium jaguaris]|uniref:Lrp/AsnC family transcriptional regulator n=1 Tax=Rhizobium jaguaris TaxID=1312183 RepID=A0A387G7Q2_9HYPH|nr:Lrp/AsnC family transcriptional regulator [Rhizobium jaguaris]AYG63911.1 Lrp/AsnC family transcriptional regulator [Rhizobium jaguaris]